MKRTTYLRSKEIFPQELIDLIAKSIGEIILYFEYTDDWYKHKTQKRLHVLARTTMAYYLYSRYRVSQEFLGKTIKLDRTSITYLVNENIENYKYITVIKNNIIKIIKALDEEIKATYGNTYIDFERGADKDFRTSYDLVQNN